jgi:hypothetical protein
MTNEIAWISGDYQFTCDAIDLDGADWYNRAGFIGDADGTTGILSVWINPTGDGTTRRIFQSGSTGSSDKRTEITLTSGNLFRIHLENSAGATIYEANSTIQFLAGTGWWCVQACWDMASASNCHIMAGPVGGDLVDVTNITILPSGTIDNTTSAAIIGADNPGGGSGSRYTGGIAEFYLANNQYLDLSVPANSRHFRKQNGKPEYLGADGALPTGVAPTCYLHVDDGGAASTFAINRAGNGDFSINGTPMIAATSPTD